MTSIVLDVLFVLLHTCWRGDVMQQRGTDGEACLARRFTR